MRTEIVLLVVCSDFGGIPPPRFGNPIVCVGKHLELDFVTGQLDIDKIFQTFADQLTLPLQRLDQKFVTFKIHFHF